jgi:polyisoprenoid-binding protein YceI
MKFLSNLLIGFLTLSLIVSCTNQPEGEAAKTGEASETEAKPSAAAKTYAVAKGNVYWAATKIGGAHNGAFPVIRGKLSAENGVVTSGIFEIDINSMTEETLPEDKKAKFLGHMKSDQFFDAESHPTGQLSIVSVESLSGNAEANYTIKANLTLKGITKSVSFPAKITVSENRISVNSPKFTINRTEWDMKFKSAIIGTAADKIIHDDVSLNIQLEADASS